MGNSLGCSASGERLVSAARDGDLIEARMLLEFNPCLAKYSTFGGLNSPLHFAAAKGHNDIVTLLLDNGADVNSRNYCGQTALMQACRHGHWEVVQTLLLYRCNVTRADYLSGRTALHFTVVDGHVRCIRLLVADFVPSAPYSTAASLEVGDRDGCSRSNSLDSSLGHRYDQIALAKFISKPADGGITALHIAALNGYVECVQLLLDLHANVAAVTFHYGSSMNLIGAGSTPLHYAACGGNLRCCQLLLSRGSSRLTLNCNGWIPVDVARIWGHHALEHLLVPNSDMSIPVFPPSNYLTLPLMSILNIAREWGLQSMTVCDDTDLCPVCLERSCNVVAEGCSHGLCVKCALYLCSTSCYTSETLGPPGSIPCPLCRSGIVSFSRLHSSPIKDLKSTPSLSFCNPCILHPRATEPPTTPCRSEFCKNREMASELICPLTCSPFPSVAIPTCYCDDNLCPTLEPQEDSSAQAQSPHRSQSLASESDKFDDHRLERTSCSGIFWSRRSCHREHLCNSEINA
ncbi:probable E3 ubiquitin-protein ligase XBOS33 [Phalaenopsis equestris]|uniref:probable E3 ubiquitin-protein ligase XBOS33 n=1 Tax=Phalaenopsis equestris TaxID=78828 RepID=UPI0009E23C6F|nr:probable E3 ubiquitin-protein ligase XBOS33 [Phalaenopsis equestris]